MKTILAYIKWVYHLLCDIFPIHGKNNDITSFLKRNLRRGGGVWGDNNSLLSESVLGDVKIRCYGNGHRLRIGNDVNYKSGHIKFENSNCFLSIGDQTTIENASFFVAEDSMSITVGTDCMLSGGIKIYTTDGHSIIDMASGSRINSAEKVVIGDHVWIGADVKILKGVNIGSNSIIASSAVVTRDVPSNSIAAGVPAKVIKLGVNWQRERHSPKEKN